MTSEGVAATPADSLQAGTTALDLACCWPSPSWCLRRASAFAYDTCQKQNKKQTSRPDTKSRVRPTALVSYSQETRLRTPSRQGQGSIPVGLHSCWGCQGLPRGRVLWHLIFTRWAEQCHLMIRSPTVSRPQDPTQQGPPSSVL